MALIGALVFLSVFLLMYISTRMLTETRSRVTRRVEVLTSSSNRESKAKKSIRTGHRRWQWVTLERLEGALVRGEIDISAKDFVIRWALVTLCIGVLALLWGGGLASLFVIGIAFFGTFLYVRGRSARRLRHFEEGLHDMLTITANSLRAGYSFMQAIQVVSEDMHGPIQEELGRILAEMNVGVHLEDAFKSAAERMQSTDFNLIVTAILIQRQVGGNLSEVLDQISETVRERVRLKREVKALTSQGRLSGLIFMLLPIGVGVMMYLISPTYMDILFQSTVGLTMLGFALVLQLIGFFVIRKIVDVEA